MKHKTIGLTLEEKERLAVLTRHVAKPKKCKCYTAGEECPLHGIYAQYVK